jgi:hypothetical protein
MADPTFGLSQYQHLFPSPNYQLQLFAPTTRTDVELRFLAENFSHDQKKQPASPVDLNRLSPGLLHAFLVVAEVGKISEAARQLHLSQPAVTAQIRRLEADPGHATVHSVCPWCDFDAPWNSFTRTASARFRRPERGICPNFDRIATVFRSSTKSTFAARHSTV